MIDYFHVNVKILNEIIHVMKEGEILIYDRIKELCVKNKISIYKLEKSLGFSSNSICKWKTSTPSVDKVQKVANYFGVTVDYLLKG